MRLLPRPTAQAHLKRRHRSEWMFKLLGLGAVFLACTILVTLLAMLAWRAVPGLQVTTMSWDSPMRGEPIVPGTERVLLREILAHRLQVTGEDAQTRRELLGLVSLAAPREMAAQAAEKAPRLRITMSDAVDHWMKMDVRERAAHRNQIRLTDRQLAWAAALPLTRSFNWRFLRAGDSREPELASFGGAIAGSLWVLLICFAVSFPLAVCTAIYLEEFKPAGRLVDIIEVNINNLAAVPSIVFGLLGLALYLNVFGLPRSAPLVGGLTLALMILPTMIIATRAALKAVPPSIRDAARGLGASELQVVLHHTFPLALPGVMTGTILGLARAIGETAPLLMIGMVAFVVDVPGRLTDPATAMPVQIYLWANNPEATFLDKTSAGILVLLVILGLLNAAAIFLRKRFEVRW